MCATGDSSAFRLDQDGRDPNGIELSKVPPELKEGLNMLGLDLGLIPVVLSAISVANGGFGTYLLLRKQNTWKDLSEKLGKIDRVEVQIKAEEKLISWLSDADSIMSSMRPRIVNRFIMLLIISISVCGFSFFDLPDSIPFGLGKSIVLENTLPSNGRIEFIDLMMLFINLLASLIYFQYKFLFGKIEREFLQNIGAIHKKFYEKFTIPAMKKINDSIRYDDDGIIIRNDYLKEIKELRKEFINIIWKQVKK